MNSGTARPWQRRKRMTKVRAVYVAAGGDTPNRHADRPPTSSDKITIRSKKRNVLVSGSTAGTWLPSHVASVVILPPLLLLLQYSSGTAFVHC